MTDTLVSNLNAALNHFLYILKLIASGWLPDCYVNWQNMLPTPVVSLEQNGTESVFIAPDAAEFFSIHLEVG